MKKEYERLTKLAKEQRDLKKELDQVTSKKEDF